MTPGRKLILDLLAKNIAKYQMEGTDTIKHIKESDNLSDKRNILQASDSEQRVVEKVSDESTVSVDNNSNIFGKCSSGDLPSKVFGRVSPNLNCVDQAEDYFEKPRKKAKKMKRQEKLVTEVTDMFVTDSQIEDPIELSKTEDEFLSDIMQFMEKTKLQLEPKPATAGDGNCWYRAAASQVVYQQIPNKPRNHKSMRLEVCNYLKSLPKQVKEDTINVVYRGKARGLTDLAYRQRKAGQWVDNTGVMVMATAHYLERNIDLYGYPAPASGSQTRLFSLTRIEGGGQADQHPPLTIFYHGSHYQTLRSVGAEEEGAA